MEEEEGRLWKSGEVSSSGTGANFQTTTQTFLSLEKPSQQTPSRFQIP